jgi:hypothetical protein
LERKIPDLCADRIDYSLREGYYWDGMDADYCVRHLVVNRGEIVFDSRRAAKVFGANYMKCQKEYWAGNEAKLRYYFIGLALREALNNRVLQMQDMYKAESEVIAKLRRSKRKSIVDNINKGLSRLKFSESRRGGINLLKKLRYVDPKFIHKGKIYRLSEVDANYRSTIEKEKKRVSKATRVTLVE